MFDDFIMKLSVLGMRIGWIWYRDVAEGSHEKEAARTVAEHRQIANAIRNRAVEEAERLASVHLRSEEHTSELQSLIRISYAVFCLKKKNYHHITDTHIH